MADEALQRRLKGQQDSRGPVGILSRGKNVYNGASTAAHSGGGSQYGRPRTAAVQTENVQPNLKEGNSFQEGPINMNPKPMNVMNAIQRRLLGGKTSGY